MTGDFNGDGKADVVVTNTSTNTVSILLANADGSYQAPQSKSVGGAPRGIGAADLNGDGKLDIVTANAGGSDVSVLLGKGDGTFQNAVSYAAGTSPYSVVVGDFNGDSKLDIATADYGSNTVSVLVGNGNGTFQAPVHYTVGSVPFSIAAGDVNGDGRSDLAVANYLSGSVSLLLGSAAGTLQSGDSVTVGTSPSSILLLDVNKDSKLDVITTNAGSNNISVALGAGTGSFAAATSTAVITAPYGLAAGDLNGDGNPDLVVTNVSSEVMVFMGSANGTFTAGSAYGLSGGGYSVAIADVNGDSKADVLVAGYSSGMAVVYLGSGNGTLQNAPISSVSGVPAVGDFNGDGKPDLAGVSSSDLKIAFGNNDGTFQGPISSQIPTVINPAVVAGDLNGDGKADIAYLGTYSDTLFVYLGKGDGTFQTALTYTIPNSPTSPTLTMADLNGDSKPDLIVSLGAVLHVLLGNGNGTFQSRLSTTVNSYSPPNITVADFNRDGKPDIAFVAPGAPLTVLLGNGNGTFQTPTTFSAFNGSYLSSADLNGDGNPDLVISNDSNSYVLLGTGGGTFGAAKPLPAFPVAPSAAGSIADFDVDGKPDLAFSTGTGTLVYRGKGDGTFESPTFYGGSDVSRTIAVDLNNDGKPDIIAGGILLNSSRVGPLTTITSNPAGRTFTVDGQSYTTPQSFPWAASTAHSVSWTTPQIANNVQYTFVGWADGPTTNQRTITAGATSSTYTANFSSTNLCTYVIGGTASIPASGGTGTLTMTAPTGCAWSATSDSAWLTITAGSGSGNGTISYSAAANAATVSRVAQVTAGGTSYGLTQAGATPVCTFVVSPLTVPYQAAGGSGSITVTTSAGCSWTAASNAAWIGINSTNATTVSYTVAATTQQRSGTLAVAGQIVTINQSAPPGPCTASLIGMPSTLPASGGTGAVSLSIGAGCAWQISSSASWLLVSPSSGNGPATITYVAQPNPSTATRNASVAGASTTQSGRSACPISLSYAGVTGPSTAGGVFFVVSTDAGCTWTPTSNVPWITVRTDGNMVLLTIAANTTGAQRFGTVSVGEATFSVTQTEASPAAGTRFVPITPCRIVDTRFGEGKPAAFGPSFISGTRDFPIPLSTCNIPGTARAYSLNFTVVPYGPLSYLTAWPQGLAQPLASNLNSPNGAVLANSAIVPAGAGGGISVYSSNPTELIIDINGYFVGSDSPTALAFYPLTPCRVMDTRAGQGTTGAFGPPSFSAANPSRTVPMRTSRCSIPATASAYSVNFTVVPSGPLAYLTTWPSGQSRPLVSTLNSASGVVLANGAIVPAGQDGSIDVFTSGEATDVIMDINGYFAPPSTGGLSLYPVTPCRVADTRPEGGKSGSFGPPSMASGGASRNFPIPTSGCGTPASAQAYAMNVTVVPTGPLSYLTIWPAGQSQPVVSTLNSADGRVVANAAIVPAGTNGAVSVYTLTGAGAVTDVILDVSGYFAP